MDVVVIPVSALLKTAATYDPLKQYRVYLSFIPAITFIHLGTVGRLF